MNASGPLTAGKTIALTFTVAGNPQFNDLNIQNDGNNSSCPTPPSLYLFFQERDDNWSGTGAYAYYRWWSDPFPTKLQVGTYTVSVALQPQNWISVFGTLGNSSSAATAGFNQALANAATIGMTFGGGCSDGHGVDLLGGSATFTLNSFTVQ